MDYCTCTFCPARQQRHSSREDCAWASWTKHTATSFILLVDGTLAADECRVLIFWRALLSFVPGIGTLADSSRRGVVASLLLGGVIAAGLGARSVLGALGAI